MTGPFPFPCPAFCRAPVAALAAALRAVWRAALDLPFPEQCVLCGAERGDSAWCPDGPPVAGLTRSDGPHLCLACAPALGPAPVATTLATGELPVRAGRRTGPELVTALSCWKYHGVRGIAWALAPLAAAAAEAAMAQIGPVDCLVPVPLHGRRRRERGFNQSEVLARLVGPDVGLSVRCDALRRVRATGQQAKLNDEEARRRNVAGAFAAIPPGPGQGRRVGLVDDLVTGGATAAAAAAALVGAGWEVYWVVALGAAVAGGDPAGEQQVDTAPTEI